MRNLLTESFACAVCGSTTANVILAHSDFSIVQCEHCKIAATLPSSFVSASDYDAAPQFTDVNVENEPQTRHYARKYLKYVRKYVSNGRLLDVGCSTGVFVDEAVHLGYDAEGIDLDSKAISYGRAKGRAVNHAGIEDWYGRNYEVILMSHTLEHIAHPLAFMSSCAERLADGGYVAVVVPCHVGLHPLLSRGWWYGWQPSQHYFHYSPKSLEILFRNSGLIPIRIWQNSMNHKPRYSSLHSLRDGMLSILSYIVASLGTITGQGDQLIGIARRTGTST